MDLSKFPTDLSNESSATLQAVQKLIMKELDQRGGFEGEVFTFIKKKEGKILNKVCWVLYDSFEIASV